MGSGARELLEEVSWSNEGEQHAWSCPITYMEGVA